MLALMRQSIKAAAALLRSGCRINIRRQMMPTVFLYAYFLFFPNVRAAPNIAVSATAAYATDEPQPFFSSVVFAEVSGALVSGALVSGPLLSVGFAED